MIPHYFNMDEEKARAFITEQAAGTLVTVDDDGKFHTTFLPVVFRDDTTIILHVARFNDQWKTTFPRPAVMTFAGPHGYITAQDYDLPEGTSTASTWDYTLVTVRGTLHLHDDQEWVAQAALDLTDFHDSNEELTADYVTRASRAIVGLELRIDSIEGQAKLSQNRLPVERERIAARLEESECPRHHALATDIKAAPSTATRQPFVGGLRSKLEH